MRRRVVVPATRQRGDGATAGHSDGVASAGGRQGKRFRAKPRGRVVDLAGGTARVRRVADAGGERRHGGKQRRELEVRADW